MKWLKPCTLFFLLLFTNALYGQGWQWAAGSTGGSEGYGMAVDAWGNSYTSGFSGTAVHFGSVTVTGFGVCGTVVIKHDGAGNFLWAKGTRNGYCKPINLACDAHGNLYLLAYYTGISLDLDSVKLINADTTGMLFVAKYSPAGNLAWAKNLCPGWPPGNIVVHGSDILVTGIFDVPSVSVGGIPLMNADGSSTTSDALLIKLDTLGNVKAASRYGNVGNDVAYVAVAPSGNVYITGTATASSITFGGITLVNADTSLFVVKMDSAWHVIWAKNEKGVGKFGSWVSSIAADSADAIYVCGTWRPAVYFGARELPADSVCDLYLVKYDSAGNLHWVNEITGNGQIGSFGVLVDPCSNVWVSGGMGDQQPGHHGSHYIKINNLRLDTPHHSADPMFIVEWDTAGNYIKAALLPTGGDDLNSIACDVSGNIFVGGDFWLGPYNIGSSSIFDPKQPSENIFVVKYLNNTSDSSIVKNLICISDSAVLSAPPGYQLYRWDDGTTDTARTVRTAGIYRLYCNGGCTAGIHEEIYTVGIGKKDTTYGAIDTSICLHARAVLHAPAGYDPYQWSNGATTQNDTISAPGTYWVVATGTCSIPSVIDTFYVAQNGVDLSFSLGNDTDVCAPILLSEPFDQYHAVWQNGYVGDTFTVTQTGAYYVTVSAQGCFNSDTINVSFPNLHTKLHDTLICIERPVYFELTANVPPTGSVLWSTGATTDSIWIAMPGMYWVTVTDAACSASDTMTVSEMYCTCKAVFPTAFTPNNDGLNDEFGPILDHRCEIIDYKFCVYNRWGNLVYVSHTPGDKWNGKIDGNEQDTGVYMYFLSYSIERVQNRHMQKGDVLLVR